MAEENMERLTTTSDKGGVAFTFNLDITCDKSEIMKILKLAEKLKEYEDLEEQGKLLKLPCAVGDTVYSFSFYRVYVMHVESFITYEDHIDVRLVSDTPENPFLKCDIDIKELGKRWFLTREVAEAALKELERGKGE